MEILIGADPEVFAIHKDTGAFISGHDLIPGNKQEPHRVKDGAVQVDGTALEFNVDPTNDAAVFSKRVRSVFSQLDKMARATNPEIQLVANPVADFEPQYFDLLPEEPKQLGCNPDFNAWSRGVNPMPEGDRPFRTGSGHIHIGFTQDADINDEFHFNKCVRLVRQLDYYLGAPSLWWDRDNRRRELYGKAGAFRPKPYGVEYRVLSNKWVTNNYLTKWIFNQANLAVAHLIEGKAAEDYFGTLAQKVINEDLYYEANQIARHCGYTLPKRCYLG